MAVSAPYAAMVIDARSGEILHAENADSRLHPASLTKMMTLHIAFEAIENGEISLDTMVTISKKAAAEPPSKLGLADELDRDVPLQLGVEARVDHAHAALPDLAGDAVPPDCARQRRLFSLAHTPAG